MLLNHTVYLFHIIDKLDCNAKVVWIAMQKLCQHIQFKAGQLEYNAKGTQSGRYSLTLYLNYFEIQNE